MKINTVAHIVKSLSAHLTEKIKDPEVNSCCLLFRFSSVLHINTSASYHQTLNL